MDFYFLNFFYGIKQCSLFLVDFKERIIGVVIIFL